MRNLLEKIMDVMIDGVRYVPAIEANSNMRAIARGLIADFWGVVKDCDLEEKISPLFKFLA